MKRKMGAWLLAAGILFLCIQAPAMAEPDVPADDRAIESAFTDPVFLAEVRKIVGKTNGEPIYPSDVEHITELDVHSLDITALDGVEYFSALTELYCYDNELRTLDLTRNPNLEILDCSFNVDLDFVDLTNCPELKRLDCNYTALEQLDMRKNPKLTCLICFSAAIKALDVSNNPLLEELDCYDNVLLALDLSHCPSLKTVDCSYNEFLASIDLSNCKELELLDCLSSSLETLDVSQSPKLKTLICYESELRTLNISNNTCLETLDAWGGHLVNLDVSNNPRLKYLDLRLHDMCAVDSVKGLENCAGLVAGETFFFEPQNGPTGRHTLGADWTTDGKNHWHACTVCGAELDKAGHVYEDDRDEACNICGYKRTAAPPVRPEPSKPSGSSGPSYNYYTITVAAGEGGRIEPAGKVSVRENRDKTFTIIPDEGHETADVLVDGKSVGTLGEYTFEKVTKAHRIEAVFQKAAVDDAPCPRDRSCPIWSYTDANAGEWYHDGVHYCIEKDIMSGYGGGKFAPNDSLSRGMTVQILYNVEGWPPVPESDPFMDVPDQKYYANAVAWASANGLVNGFGDGAFRPDAPVTREQLAVILCRYAAWKGYDTAARADLSAYVDAERVSAYAQRAMAWANAAGLITGTDGGGLHPDGSATRAETAAILMRFCEGVIK